MPVGVQLVLDGPGNLARADQLSQRFGFAPAITLEDLSELTDSRSEKFDEFLAPYRLHLNGAQSYLSWHEGRKKQLKQHTLSVSFVDGANAHRRVYGGGKGQAIAKAVGVQSKFRPSVLDATAGQGGDAFVLASLGCQVTMLERSPVAFILLESALAFAQQTLQESDESQGPVGASDPDHAHFSGHQPLADVLDRLCLRFGSLLDDPSIEDGATHDVVYLDPMFPERKKSAAVKKEMRVFHDIIGEDKDSDSLLECALKVARYRVVVKRPKLAPFLAEAEPTYQIKGKSTRFDIYVNRAIPHSEGATV